MELIRSTIAMLLLVVISSADSTPNKVGPSVNNDGSESGGVSEEQPRLSNMGGHGEVEERKIGTGGGVGFGGGAGFGTGEFDLFGFLVIPFV